MYVTYHVFAVCFLNQYVATLFVHDCPNVNKYILNHMYSCSVIIIYFTYIQSILLVMWANLLCTWSQYISISFMHISPLFCD